MTTVQRVAQIFGVVFILFSIAGFFASSSMATGMMLGLFPVNLLHNVVHLLFGVWGLVASRTFDGAVAYGKIGGIIYLVLAIVGFVAPDGFGLVPLGGHDIWLHALLGVALAVVGFTARPTVDTTPRTV